MEGENLATGQWGGCVDYDVPPGVYCDTIRATESLESRRGRSTMANQNKVGCWERKNPRAPTQVLVRDVAVPAVHGLGDRVASIALELGDLVAFGSHGF